MSDDTHNKPLQGLQGRGGRAEQSRVEQSPTEIAQMPLWLRGRAADS